MYLCIIYILQYVTGKYYSVKVFFNFNLCVHFKDVDGQHFFILVDSNKNIQLYKQINNKKIFVKTKTPTA